MRSLGASAAALLRDAAMLLLRRRSCCGPLLLLLGAALCLFYQSLTVAPGPQRPTSGRGKPAEEALLEETRRLITSLETAQVQIWSRLPPRRRRAVVLTGRHLVSDTEVQLYQQVLQHMGYQVQLSRYAETSSFLGPNHGVSGWSLLLCLSSSERSCLRRISFSHLQRHQMVNLLPELMEAFSDAGGGLCHLHTHSHVTGAELPMRPRSCGSTNQKLALPQASAAVDRKSPVGAPPPALVAMVNVYVLVTSANPLIAFLHDISVVTTNQEQQGQATKLSSFLLQQLGAATSHHALGQVKKVIGDVLQAAVSTNEKPPTVNRCVLCYQLLTFTLLFSGSVSPVVVQVDRDLTFSSLAEDTFDGRISRDLILDDSLRFLLSWGTSGTQARHRSRSSADPAPVTSSSGVCLSEDDFLLLLQFQQQVKTPSAFTLLYPSSCCSSCCSCSSCSSCSCCSSSCCSSSCSSCSSSCCSSSSSGSSSSPPSLSDLLVRISCFYELQTNLSLRSAPPLSQDATEGVCVDPHLRQIYMDPPLILTPPFSPEVKEYHTEVNFDTVMVRIRPEPVSSACRVHLDEHRGPRMANYPIGLGESRISILVTDDTAPKPVVMAVYTVHMYRESRPSLPMFGDHVTCSFRQDCGLMVQPGLSCGLQPFITSQTPSHTCRSGHVSGQWVVPCLSCSDNRTCDWREVAWQPDDCYHPVVGRPLLQQCMQDRKVLFIGDSTNRGMMYFLMERVNSSLEDWGKVHDTLVYRDLNGGRTLVSYSYYPQFWLDKSRRPTFRQALLQLIHRSRPLANSNLTALVVGGVQWLNTDHLRTIREVLNRESLSNVQVLVKSLGMGFHLPVDGIRSLSLNKIQQLHKENHNIIAAAKHHGYDVIDTFSITMGRYKEFLQGRCACHFHEVERIWSSGTNRTSSGFTSQSAVLDMDQEVWPKASSYHVRGPVNQVYSEILLSRLCPRTRG